MKEVEIKNESSKGCGGGKHHGFKKKGGKFKKQQSMETIFSRFRVQHRREGPELYVKTIKRLGLYVSAQLKNGSDVKKCLM